MPGSPGGYFLQKLKMYMFQLSTTLDIMSESSIFMLTCDKEYYIDPEQTVKIKLFFLQCICLKYTNRNALYPKYSLQRLSVY